MAFKVGEKVVYPNHGIGIVEEIAVREMGSAPSRFYMLRLKATDSVVMVPVDNWTRRTRLLLWSAMYNASSLTAKPDGSLSAARTAGPPSPE